jgi:hypothetical protein
MISNLPKEIWMKILTERAATLRIDWWNSLDEIEQEYMEWPMHDEEMAEEDYDHIFRGFTVDKRVIGPKNFPKLRLIFLNNQNARTTQ